MLSPLRIYISLLAFLLAVVDKNAIDQALIRYERVADSI